MTARLFIFSFCGLLFSLPLTAQVSSFSAHGQGTQQMRLSWQLNDTSVTQIEVYRRSLAQQAFVHVVGLAPSLNQYDDTGLQANTEYRYFLRLTRPSGTVHSDTIAGFTLPAVPTIRADSACQGHPVTLRASGASRYHWYSSATSPTPLTDNSGQIVEDSIFQTPPITQTVTYFVAAVGQGYESERDSITVEPYVHPEVFILGGEEQLICDSVYTLEINTVENANYFQWLRNNQPIPGATGATHTITQSGTYSARIYRSPCLATTAPVRIVLGPAPPAEILGGTPQGACDEITLHAREVPNANYEWKDENGRLLGTGTSFTTDRSGTYTLVATYGGCDNLDHVQVNIFPFRDVLQLADSAFRCPNSPLTLRGPSHPQVVFSWLTPNGEEFFGNTLSLPAEEAPAGAYIFTAKHPFLECELKDTVHLRISPEADFVVRTELPTCFGKSDGKLQVSSAQDLDVFLEGQRLTPPNFLREDLPAGNYTVSVTTVEGCSFSREVSIEEGPAMEVEAPESFTISTYGEVELWASGADYYRWSPAYGLDDSTSYTPTASPAVTTVYTVRGYSNQGCVGEAQVRVRVLDESALEPSKIVSPNADGYSDTWIVLNILAFPDAEVTIFNRWGQQIYSASPYLNDWEGTAPNGDYLPTGTYYYQIVLGNGKIFTGHVNVLY